MTQYSSPVSAMFEAQRQAIKQSQQAVESGVQFQRNASRVALTGLKAQESIQRQGLEVAQTAAQGSIGAVESTGRRGGAVEGRRTVDDQFAQFEQAHAEVFDALEGMFRQGIDSYDDISEDYLDTLDEQVEEFLELHDEAGEQLTDDFEEYTEEFGEQIEAQLERTEQLQERFESQFERQNQQTEQLLERQAEQIEQLQSELAERTAELQEQLNEQIEDAQHGEQPPDAEPEAAIDQLESVEGIDPEDAERLRSAGYETPDAVAGANPDELAVDGDVAEKRAREWIESAQLP